MRKATVSRKEKLDTYHYHEVLDRTHVIASNVSDFLLNHPAIDQNEDLKALAEKASDTLGDLYQAIGRKIPD